MSRHLRRHLLAIGLTLLVLIVPTGAMLFCSFLLKKLFGGDILALSFLVLIVAALFVLRVVSKVVDGYP